MFTKAAGQAANASEEKKEDQQDAKAAVQEEEEEDDEKDEKDEEAEKPEKADKAEKAEPSEAEAQEKTKDKKTEETKDKKTEETKKDGNAQKQASKESVKVDEPVRNEDMVKLLSDSLPEQSTAGSVVVKLLSVEEAEKNLATVVSNLQQDRCGIDKIGFLKSRVFVRDFAEGVMHVTNGAAFEKKRMAQIRLLRSMKQLVAALASGASDLTGRITEITKRKQTEEKKNMEKAAANALQMEKIVSNVEGAKHRAMRSSGNKELVCPFIDEASTQFAIVPYFDADKDALGPCIFGTSHTTEWRSIELVNREMATFGARHKQEKQYKSELKSQNPMLPKKGKEDTEKYHQGLIEKLGTAVKDVSKYTPKGWANASWQYGYAPTYNNIGATPNCSCLLRTLCYSNIMTLLIETQSLRKAVEAIEKDTFPKTVPELKKIVKEADTATVQSLKNHGLVAYYICQEKDTVLYVPAGWVVVDKVAIDQVLMYGVRKSFFFDSQAMVENVKILVNMMQSDPQAKVGQMVDMVTNWEKSA